MPNIDLSILEGKRIQHPHLAEAKRRLVSEKTERITIQVEAGYARKIKAEAKARGLTIKQFVMQALDDKYDRG